MVFTALIIYQLEEEIKAAKEREDFLMTMAVECSEEVGFDLEGGNKLLLGDLSIRSKEAQVILGVLSC